MITMQQIQQMGLSLMGCGCLLLMSPVLFLAVLFLWALVFG